MKQLPRIASALFCEPWAILPAHHENLCQQFVAHLEAGGSEDTGRVTVPEGGPIEGVADDPVGPHWRDEEGKLHAWHPQVQVVGSTAILPVRGVIGKHLSTLAMWCGGCDAALVARQAQHIAQDPRITDVVVHIDSPGGSCVGAVETALALRAMSGVGRSTYAYTDTMAASNGYFWAAACDEVWAAPSAIVGSISTFSAALDQSRAYAELGLERLVFRSGKFKGTGTPGKAWTEEEKQDQIRVVEQFSAQFKGAMREWRGLSDEEMQGQYWPAEFAPQALVDGLATDLGEFLDVVALGAVGSAGVGGG